MAKWTLNNVTKGAITITFGETLRRMGPKATSLNKGFETVLAKYGQEIVDRSKRNLQGHETLKSKLGFKIVRERNANDKSVNRIQITMGRTGRRPDPYDYWLQKEYGGIIKPKSPNKFLAAPIAPGLKTSPPALAWDVIEDPELYGFGHTFMNKRKTLILGVSENYNKNEKPTPLFLLLKKAGSPKNSKGKFIGPAVREVKKELRGQLVEEIFEIILSNLKLRRKGK